MASYKCTSVGCYSVGSPATNTLFQQLQTLVNQFAPSAGIDPIGVDGIIGKGTTQATLIVLETLIDAANANPMNTASSPLLTSAPALDTAINGPADLAALAQDVVNALSLAAQAQIVGTLPPAALPAPTPAPSVIQVATTTANKPASPSTQTAQLKLTGISRKSGLSTSLIDALPPWASYVGGAALVAGAIAVVLKAKKERRTAPVAGYRRLGETARVYFAETAKTRKVQITPETWRKLRELKRTGDTYYATTRNDYLALRPYVEESD